MNQPGSAFEDIPQDALRELSQRYRFEQEISGGLVARVFRVYDLRLERTVALKLLRPEIGLSIGRERFTAEIRIAASLVHPHIVPVHDSGTTGGLLYFTMPFIEGGSLRARMEREGQLSREEVVRVSRAVAGALTYAHSRDILHRDVKPENIMLDGSAVLLTDFGIARLMHPDRSSPRTSVGLTVGTPAYMSPEQASAQSEIDGRSDTYALACVAYEMLAGEPPFTGPTAQVVIARHLGDTPQPVRAVRSSLPAQVDGILGRALSKSPADRFGTPSEFAEQLERALLTPGEMEATVVTPAAIARATVTPRPVAIVAVVASLLAIAALLLARRQGPLDARRVALFPVSGVDSASAQSVVTYLGYVLEGTEPLRWENGVEWLGEGTRAGSGVYRALARKHGAGLFLDGTVLETGDSTTVVMRLHDVLGDSIVARRGRSGPLGSSIPRLAAAATAEILPFIVGVEGAPDVGGLRDRPPAAIANLLQGDRSYATAHYEEAVRFYLRAAEDTGFALPLVRAAQAMAWIDRQDVAESLMVAAASREQFLPTRYRTFARGVLYLRRGLADSAAAAAHRAVESDSMWAEAWMLLGEVHYHLMPQVTGLDSLADAAFRSARRAAPRFQPPLYHIGETALRAGDVVRAAAVLDTLRRGGADSLLTRPLALMVRCAQGRMTPADWRGELGRGSVDVLEAAKSLSGSPAFLQCAADGFRAVAEWDSTSVAQRFGALQGLQGVLLAQDDLEGVRALLDSERARAASAHFFYVWDAAAGLGLDAEAEVVVQDLEARPGPRSNSIMWLLGVWYASRGRDSVARALADTLTRRADSTGTPGVRLLADIVSAHALLASGDTVGALASFRALRPIARQRELAWTPWDALALERLTLARLLAARGDNAGVLEVSSAFDAPLPVMFIGLRPAVLALRADAAERLAKRRLAREYRERLTAFRAREGPAHRGDERS